MNWKKTGQSPFAQGIERGYFAVTEDGRQDFFLLEVQWINSLLSRQTTNHQNDPVDGQIPAAPGMKLKAAKWVAQVCCPWKLAETSLVPVYDREGSVWPVREEMKQQTLQIVLGMAAWTNVEKCDSGKYNLWTDWSLSSQQEK